MDIGRFHKWELFLEKNSSGKRIRSRLQCSQEKATAWS